ncbi:hypothetical protein L914_12611 [Phytophthora nicotianae]|uniref:Uncharacterized protein n=1 Tax=Phytophthora nicotianae TaxID=4792 RepID=W2MZ48_PHYNI|nr:hypothetical protein L914_12611 [Phytophthora nicotianae]
MEQNHPSRAPLEQLQVLWSRPMCLRQAFQDWLRECMLLRERLNHLCEDTGGDPWNAHDQVDKVHRRRCGTVQPAGRKASGEPMYVKREAVERYAANNGGGMFQNAAEAVSFLV